MNKVLCIFPQEQTTSFLQPVYDMLVRMGAEGFNHNTVESDEDLQSILHAQINESDFVIVLCHGCSTCLYGTQGELGFDGNELLSGGDLFRLKDKKLVLFLTFFYQQILIFLVYHLSLYYHFYHLN